MDTMEQKAAFYALSLGSQEDASGTGLDDRTPLTLHLYLPLPGTLAALELFCHVNGIPLENPPVEHPYHDITLQWGNDTYYHDLESWADAANTCSLIRAYKIERPSR